MVKTQSTETQSAVSAASAVSALRGRAPGALPRDLPRLTALRAVAALMVFGYHLELHHRGGTGGVFGDGYAGVAFFFVLSGFVLTWGSAELAGAGRAAVRPLAFLRRRFARIYPSHAVMVLIAAVVPVVAMQRDALAAIAALTLTQAWLIGHNDLIFGMNGVSWTLSVEASFYVAFPFVLAALLRLSPAQRGRVALIWFAGTAVVIALATASHTADGIATINPVFRFAEFLLGMVAALAIRGGWRPRWSLAQALALCVVVLAVTTASGMVKPLPNPALTLPFLALIVAAAAADLAPGRGWLTSRAAIYAGEVSFAFYLVHELVILNLPRLTHLHGAPDALSLLLVSGAAAVVLHHLVERPAQRWLTGGGRPRRRVPVTSVHEPVADAGLRDQVARG